VLCRKQIKKEELDMSEEGGYGVALAERFFGLIILVIGVLSMYYTWTSTQALGGFVGFFAFLNVILIVLGAILMTAKTE
jgi:hypothetical protein